MIADRYIDIVDKAGLPYHHHLYRVANKFIKESYIIGLLHDIIEDGLATYPELVEEFNKDIADAVLILTRRDYESYSEYITRVGKSGNEDAIAVKLADLYDNMNLFRFDSISYEDVRRVRKYSRAYAKLANILIDNTNGSE
jgi:(p)ppGpp synthase/HD superfamily hydrolase